MYSALEIDYPRLAEEAGVVDEAWDAFVREQLVERWVACYESVTGWRPQVLEIEQDELTFLFDAGPTLGARGGRDAADRVVAVWGRSRRAPGARDRGRLAGLIAVPWLWSGRSRDRGHLVSHQAGGGLDLNIVPQASAVNRGWSADGRRWRQMERYAAEHPGTPLFVRPVYDDPGWSPAVLEQGQLRGDRLVCERFVNRE